MSIHIVLWRNKVPILCAFVVTFILFYFSDQDRCIAYSRTVREWVPKLSERDIVFFVDTSWLDTGEETVTLNSRSSCAMEAASRQYPNKTIRFYVLNSTVDEEDVFWSEVLQSKVQIHQIFLEEVFVGTQLEPWYQEGVWRSSSHKAVHMSDAIRLLLLYQYGGVSVETDGILLRRLDELPPNTVGTEIRSLVINNAVMKFEEQNRFLRQALDSFHAFYDLSNPFSVGHVLLTMTMNGYCIVQHLLAGGFWCADVYVAEHDELYPISFLMTAKFHITSSEEVFQELLEKSYHVHLSDAMHFGFKSTPGSQTLMDRIFEYACPETHKVAIDQGIQL